MDDFFKYSAENPGPSVMQISIETGRESCDGARQRVRAEL